MNKPEGPITEYTKIRRYVMTLILRAGQRPVRIPTVVELAKKLLIHVKTAMAEDMLMYLKK